MYETFQELTDEYEVEDIRERRLKDDPKVSGWGTDSALFIEKNRSEGRLGRKDQLSVNEHAEF